MIKKNEHVPVMLNEVLEALQIKENGIYIDLTLGGGGHFNAILSKLNKGSLIGIDKDEQAIKDFKNSSSLKILLINDNYVNLSDILHRLKIEKVDGVLLDLGVSSHQLDDAQRGFSFNQEAKLDMRMDHEAKLSAYDVVNSYTRDELENIIRMYGEEKMAGRIARTISEKRELHTVETTRQLAAIIASSMPAKLKWQKIHPATRTFQAIRIAVNNELDNIKPAINDATRLLNSGGRVCIISFHSLEDRLVKKEFGSLAGVCTCPKNIPYCICKKKAELKIITKKALMPSPKEIENNPRARSAKLRVAERV